MDLRLTDKVDIATAAASGIGQDAGPGARGTSVQADLLLHAVLSLGAAPRRSVITAAEARCPSVRRPPGSRPLAGHRGALRER